MTRPTPPTTDHGQDRPVLTVVGAGPGTGAAVARRFGREGWAVGLVARDLGRLDRLAAALLAEGTHAAATAADATRPDELRAALRDLAARLGQPAALLFAPLPDVSLIRPVLETAPEDLRTSLQLNVVGAAAAVAEVLPAMRVRSRGTLMFTTGSGALHPNSARAASAVTTSAASVYLRLLHEACAPIGVVVTHTTVVGPVGPGQRHEPADVAEHLYRRHEQQDGGHRILR